MQEFLNKNDQMTFCTKLVWIFHDKTNLYIGHKYNLAKDAFLHVEHISERGDLVLHCANTCRLLSTTLVGFTNMDIQHIKYSKPNNPFTIKIS